MAKSLEERPVIFTDDGWIMYHDPPLTPEIIRDKVVKSFEGTPASLWWAVGGREVYHYETQVGEILGEGHELSELPDELRTRVGNTRHLMETNGGPLTVLSSLCREAGLEFFPRVRMNEHYSKDPSAVDAGRFRREHPELLIGRPGEEIPKGTIDWDIRTGLDFAYQEVRDYIFAITTELFERFDVDGVEMDFNRHPTFFRREESYQNRYLMTDLVKRVKERMKQVSAEKGREIELAVRVPPTIADSTRIGLDVVEWMDDGLVDIVVAGKGSIPFEMPIREFVEAAEGTGIPVYGCIEGLKPIIDENPIRALAARMWSAGAGVYLYNYFTLPAEWKRRMLNQIADPKTLARLDKRYEIDHADRIQYGGHGGSFQNSVPAAQLPVVLDNTFDGQGPILRMDIADDVEAASADGSLGRCVLGILLDDFTPLDELDIRLNGEAVPWSSGRTAYLPWPDVGMAGFPLMAGKRSIQFDLDCPPLRQGENEVEVRFSSYGDRGYGDKYSAFDGQRATKPAVLIGVEITITYRKD